MSSRQRERELFAFMNSSRSVCLFIYFAEITGFHRGNGMRLGSEIYLSPIFSLARKQSATICQTWAEVSKRFAVMCCAKTVESTQTVSKRESNIDSAISETNYM